MPLHFKWLILALNFIVFASNYVHWIALRLPGDEHVRDHESAYLFIVYTQVVISICVVMISKSIHSENKFFKFFLPCVL